MQLLERAAAKARARTQPGRAWALALGADCTYGAIAYDVEMQQVREQDVDAAHQCASTLDACKCFLAQLCFSAAAVDTCWVTA